MWKGRRKAWKSIPRIYTVSPKFTELFCLRLLVYVVKGPRSFECLRTLDDGTVCETFCEAARVSMLTDCALVQWCTLQRRGLVNDQREWEFAMREASAKDMPQAIRRLFATVVIYCIVVDKRGECLFVRWRF